VTRAWLMLDAALALHVADEALTGFLDFYNPLVLQIRHRLPWFPMPTFTFRIWLAGLIALVIVLAALTPAIRTESRVARWLARIFAIIMLANGFGHLAGSLYFVRWLPGTTSAPLLLIAAELLLRRTMNRGGQ
jgi:hypothetical protein